MKMAQYCRSARMGNGSVCSSSGSRSGCIYSVVFKGASRIWKWHNIAAVRAWVVVVVVVVVDVIWSYSI